VKDGAAGSSSVEVAKDAIMSLSPLFIASNSFFLAEEGGETFITQLDHVM
jgi:hypothetical protein